MKRNDITRFIKANGDVELFQDAFKYDDDGKIVPTIYRPSGETIPLTHFKYPFHPSVLELFEPIKKLHFSKTESTSRGEKTTIRLEGDPWAGSYLIAGLASKAPHQWSINLGRPTPVGKEGYRWRNTKIFANVSQSLERAGTEKGLDFPFFELNMTEANNETLQEDYDDESSKSSGPDDIDPDFPAFEILLWDFGDQDSQATATQVLTGEKDR